MSLLAYAGAQATSTMYDDGVSNSQNTHDKRHYPMPSDDRLRSSAFLRCSNAKPEEKVAH